jgi:hypothetical protein
VDEEPLVDAWFSPLCAEVVDWSNEAVHLVEPDMSTFKGDISRTVLY